MPKIIKVINNWTEYTFWWGSDGSVLLDAPTNVTAKAGNTKATITWTDPDDLVIDWHTLAKWKCSKLVRKEWSAPTSSSDGTVVATFTTKNKHQTDGFEDTGLVNGTTYYYAVFAISTADAETQSDSVSVKPQEYRTMTVKWTEWATTAFADYEDDAAGLPAESTEFDKFFDYSLVKVNTNWVVTEEVTQTASGWYGKLDFSKLSSTSSGDNVMIKFPKRGIKISKSWTTVTLSITDDPNKSWFQYYAFQSWQINNITNTYDQMYMWAFKSVASWSTAKSWWWGTIAPQISQTQSAACTAAKANNTSLLWNIVDFYQRSVPIAYWIIKYKTTNFQSKIWNWVVSWSKTNTWTLLNTNKIDATYGTTADSTTQVRLFWVEDFWWNVSDWVWGFYTDWSKTLYTQLSGYSGTIGWWVSTWTTITTTSWNCLSSIAGNNEAMFAPIWTVSNSNYNTYYCDDVYVDASCLAFAGGNRAYGSSAGAFHLDVSPTESDFDDSIGSRLVLLN